MKLKTLKDLIKETFKGSENCWYHKQINKNVKEFIKKLKETFNQETYWQKLCFEIDKLSGELK